MFHLETLRLIRHTLNRFLSLVTISAIGVAFMMGLFSSREIMEKSVDRYDDEMHLQDLQIYSAYGFDENDIAAIKKQEFVESCFPSRMADVMCRDERGDSRVIRLEELDRSINGFVLVDGRMPEKEDEIVVVRGSALKITL